MRDLIVYLGSDHVIQQPGFDFQENTLSMTCNFRDAAAQACKRNAAGILNTYRIDLDLLSDKDIVFYMIKLPCVLCTRLMYWNLLVLLLFISKGDCVQ